MSATIVSFAQFQESRRRRQSVRLPGVQPAATPDDLAPDDRPLTVNRDVPSPASPAPVDPAPRS